jgi:hypothetical protein
MLLGSLVTQNMSGCAHITRCTCSLSCSSLSDPQWAALSVVACRHASHAAGCCAACSSSCVLACKWNGGFHVYQPVNNCVYLSVNVQWAPCRSGSSVCCDTLPSGCRHTWLPIIILVISTAPFRAVGLAVWLQASVVQLLSLVHEPG